MYIDEEKRARCISAVVDYLNTLDTWEKFLDFIKTVSKAKMKPILKSVLEDSQIEDDTITSTQDKITNDQALANEINQL